MYETKGRLGQAGIETLEALASAVAIVDGSAVMAINVVVEGLAGAVVVVDGSAAVAVVVVEGLPSTVVIVAAM